MTMYCGGGDGVTGGASFVVLTAEQSVITLICYIAADPNIHTTTSRLYVGTFDLDTATLSTWDGGIISKVFTVLVRIVTIATRSTLFRLVGR